MLAIDANVWVYYLDGGLPEHEQVAERLDEVLDARALFVNTAIQMEVVHYVSKQVDETDVVVAGFLDLDGVTIADLTTDDVRRGAALLSDHPHVGIGGRDASLVATMERRDVSELWTHDEALQRLDGRLDWLTVEDPAAD